MYSSVVRVRLSSTSLFLVPLVLVLFTAPLHAQIDMDEVYAGDEFRWGVKAFNNGYFNQAILSFEKALSYTPEDIRIQEWLGRAYYRSGFVETALRIWETILERGMGSALLKNRIDIISFRKGLGRELYRRDRYVVAAEIEGRLEEYNLFLKPTAILTTKEGNFYVVAYGSNEIVLFNANGGLERRLRGGLVGFDHPFDAAEAPDGNLFVSEFEGDRITKCNQNGYPIFSFGGRGRGAGELVGPQYLDIDDEGYLYVTDFGNRRVSKFDVEGNFVLSFGERSSGFAGFRSPSGIAVRDGRIYVADTVRKRISVFDTSGNHLENLGEGILRAPEDISFIEEDILMIADTERLVRFDVTTEQLEVISDLEGGDRRIMSGRMDENGNILTADFENDSVQVLTELSSLYAGLWVEIQRVVSKNYPSITLAVEVSTRLGTPVSGLGGSNFIITEEGRPVANPAFDYAVDAAEVLDSMILVEKSIAMADYRDRLSDAVGTLAGHLRGAGRIGIVTAGDTPVVDMESGTTPRGLVESALRGENSDSWSFDAGLRLAASELVRGNARRTLFFVTTGNLGGEAFSRYGLLESVQYLKNNNIVFNAVLLERDAEVSEELDFLARETGGEVRFLYEPAGIEPLVDKSRNVRSGTYFLTFDSVTYGDFGRAFIPVEVEVNYYKRSGRDESGYYAPLEY